MEIDTIPQGLQLGRRQHCQSHMLQSQVNAKVEPLRARGIDANAEGSEIIKDVE